MNDLEIPMEITRILFKLTRNLDNLHSIILFKLTKNFDNLDLNNSNWNFWNYMSPKIDSSNQTYFSVHHYYLDRTQFTTSLFVLTNFCPVLTQKILS